MEPHHTGISVVRDLDPSRLAPMDEREVSTVDGLMVNHEYCDIRGCTAGDLAHAIAEDAGFFEAFGHLDEYDPGEVIELLNNHFEDADSSLDVGVTAAVVAISAAGDAPISSCNGGWFGDTHASEVPYMLFSIGPGDLAPIQAAAEAAGCGPTTKGRYAELYADQLPKMLEFSR